MEIFADDISRPEEFQLVFISDRQKICKFCSVILEWFTSFAELTCFVCLFGYLQGLIPAIETLFPTVEHRYCMKHIYKNFKVDHKGLELKDALWRCATAITTRKFERCMQYIKDFDEKAYKYLANIAPAQWTRSHFTLRALTDCLVNNLSVSFNPMILKSRAKPVLAILEWIRVRLMTRLYTKSEGIEKYAVSCVQAYKISWRN